MTWT